ncbi:MAG: NlpC/P60 family protein [Hespellia sp.]|nr:NlpC/P60 family protein [Hespellia sp.]
MNKLGRALLVAAMIASMVVTPVGATDSTSSLQNSKAQVQGEVSSLQAELTQLMEKVDELESNMVTKGEEINQAEVDLEAAQEKEKQQYEDMKLRIKYMYEEGDNSALEKILTSGSISELLSQAEYVSTLHTYDRNMLQEYVDTQQQISDLKTSLEADMASMEDMKSEFTSEKENLDATLIAKQGEIANLDEQIQAAAAAAAKAAAEKAAAEAAAQAAAAGTSTGSNEAFVDNGGTASNGSGDTTVVNTSNGGGNSSSGNTNTDNPDASDNSSGGDTSNAGSGSGSSVVGYAEQFVGNPYVWGGTSLTNGCDCSGFVMSVYAAFGVSLPHSSGALRSVGYGVSYSEAQPGDIICYSGHVGIYAGGGTIVNAIDDAHGIGYSSATYSTILAVRRIF